MCWADIQREIALWRGAWKLDFKPLPESVATLPTFGPIEGQKWFDQISSQWKSQKNRFALIYFGKILRQERDLKVLSSEMDSAEIRLIRLIFIKGRGAAVLKNSSVPHPVRGWEPFKDSAPSNTVIGHCPLGTVRPNTQWGVHRSDCTFGFTSYKDWKTRYKKINYQWPIAE